MLSKINEIIESLEIEEDTTTIWSGDFNLFFDVQSDADGGSPKLKLNSVCKLPRIMSENDLCDIYPTGYVFLTKKIALPGDAKPVSSKEGLTTF